MYRHPGAEFDQNAFALDTEKPLKAFRMMQQQCFLPAH
jgi:hypothetical protein